jgi:molybdopterin converting factor small subunit
MASEEHGMTVAVIAFGQVGEQLGGRHHERTVQPGLTVRDLVVELGLEEWITFGLSVALNGDRCGMDTPLVEGAEIALLPPVSGG